MRAIQNLWLDLRYAVRQMGRRPGFAAMSVLLLALGVGATAAVFSIVWAALLDPFPYPTATGLYVCG